ncbi:hypothetical protein BpHYR1_016041 [Brachionus plicatilis]|uniref:Uncharacterized protein n=1 Tax=Brachionus plicatilis TaxID=10195 RepID=A0A3M7R3Y7_BRAPC|nr:hypothetical protein BpHYR1_016041 [Brachionus plicatilis]
MIFISGSYVNKKRNLVSSKPFFRIFCSASFKFVDKLVLFFKQFFYCQLLCTISLFSEKLVLSKKIFLQP